MNDDLFDLRDATDRSRLAVFGRVIRAAQFLALAGPDDDPQFAQARLIALGERFADGAVFFSLATPGRRSDAAVRPRRPIDGEPQ